jgi:hypothetical protein
MSYSRVAVDMQETTRESHVARRTTQIAYGPEHVVDSEISVYVRPRPTAILNYRYILPFIRHMSYFGESLR